MQTQPKGMPLAERFRRTLRESPDRLDYEAMTLEELGGLQITFGEAKRGQLFSHVIQNDPKYVTWFAGKYGSKEPPHPNHIGFLTFIRKYVEKSEVNNQHAQSKAKAKSKPKTGEHPDNSASEEEMEEPTWDLLEKQVNQEDRLDRFEYSMGLLLQQVSEMVNAMSKGSMSQGSTAPPP